MHTKFQPVLPHRKEVMALFQGFTLKIYESKKEKCSLEVSWGKILHKRHQIWIPHEILVQKSVVQCQKFTFQKLVIWDSNIRGILKCVIHCFFVCEKICEISRRFLEVLKIFDPAFTFDEVIKLRSKEEFPHVNWFIAYTLYYIYNNRQRCSVSQYITFLQTELEILKFSKKKNIEEEIRVLSMMIELIE